MAINKALKLKKVPVMWEGEEAAVIRGLVPNDIAQIIRLAGERIHDVLAAIEEHDMLKSSNTPIEEKAQQILDELPKTIQRISASVPEFVALIIAYAAGAGDDQEAVDHIRNEWSIALQFECLAQIARETFVDEKGFRAFVGNVVALLNSGNVLTSGAKAKKLTGRERGTSDAG